MFRSISTVVWIFIKVQKCYKKFKLCNCYIPLSVFYRILTKGKDGSKHRTTTFDTVLESWDFILVNEKILGTIGVPLWVPFGTQSVPINVENFKKSIFYNTNIRHNGNQNSTVKYALSDRIEKGKTVQLNTNFVPQMKRDKCKSRANSK